MTLLRKLPAMMAVLAIIAFDARAEAIADMRYAVPVERYGHFALGRPHEYARLLVTTDAGRKLEFALPENEVFEDIAPRRVRLAASEAEEILAIVSRRGDGARLVLIALRDGTLKISAQSQPIGTPMRWLNPVGVVDLDGDGRAEIAAVITPHIGGVLKIFRRSEDKLVEIAALGGFSNHIYGSPKLNLSTSAVIGTQRVLLVPDNTRRTLRLIALQRGQLIEMGRCELAAPVVGAVSVVSPVEVSVELQSGRQVVMPGACLKSTGATPH